MARLIAELLDVWRFVHERTGVALASDMKAIGLERGGRIVAGVVYENWTGTNAWMHIAIEPGTIVSPVWARYVFAYPFDEVGVERLTAEVAGRNRSARRLVKRVGFRMEACLRGAGAMGDDILIYRLTRDGCRLLRPRDASMAGSRQPEGVGARVTAKI